jgi:hypothetical protein
MTLNHDPQEDDPLLNAKIEAALQEALANLADVPMTRGFCHRLWPEQKRILREKYQIDWKTPAEMNPMVLFD